MKAFRSRWVLFISSCLIRLIYVSVRGFENFEAGDTPIYDTISTNLVSGEGFSFADGPTAARVPGYPLFLALIYLPFGAQNHFPVQIVQILLGATIPLVLLAIGREMGDERVGWFAGWVGALHINLIFWTGYVLNEGLYIPVLMATFYLLLRTRRNDSTGSLIFAGLSMGILLMIKPASLPFLATVPLWFAWSRWRSGRRILRSLCLLLLFAVLVLIPWTARNYMVFKRFVPVSTGGPIALWYGTQWDEVDRAKGPINDPTEGLNLNQFSAREMYLNAFIAYVKADPLRYAILSLRKGVSFWSLYFPQYSPRHKAANIAFFAPIFVLSVVGLFAFASVDNEGIMLFWLLLLSTTLLHMLTLVDYDGRYRVPLEPILGVTAGMGFFWLLDHMRPHSASERA